MAVIKISSTRNVVRAINYVLDEKSKDGIHERVADVSSHNMTVSNAHNEAMATIQRFNKTNNIHAQVIIQSFSTEELNPTNQDHIRQANSVGMALAKELWGDTRQLLVVTQTDNGKVHNHLIGVSPDLLTGKSIRGNARNVNFVRNKSDELIKKHEIKNINAEINNEYRNRQTIGEVKRREQGQYVWKDDLKQRISLALENVEVTDNTAFIEEMKKYNVDVKINGKGNISYAFTDKENKLRKSRASKLGNIYGKEGINYGITDNRVKQKQQDRRIAELSRRARATNTKLTTKSINVTKSTKEIGRTR